MILCSEFECPELPQGSGLPDVYIRLGAAPEHLAQPAGQGVPFEWTPGQFLLKIRSVARFLVLNGSEIIVEPEPGADSDSIRAFLLGTAMGELLHQRGLLPLHASAILTRRGAIVLAGPSAIGKSAVAAAFWKRGFEVIADDLCALSVPLNPAEKPSVRPAIPYLALWPDSLVRLGIDAGGLRPVRPLLERYLHPLDCTSAREAGVQTLYFLSVGSGVTIDPIDAAGTNGKQKVMTLAGHTYRRLFSTDMKLSVDDSRMIKAAARRTRMVRVTRPRDGWHVDEIADRIQQDFEA